MGVEPTRTIARNLYAGSWSIALAESKQDSVEIMQLSLRPGANISPRVNLAEHIERRTFRVRRTDGLPAKAATILSTGDGVEHKRVGRTDDQGRFEITCLRHSSAHLTVLLDGCVPGRIERAARRDEVILEADK